MRDRFSAGVAERIRHYVYLLIDPRDDSIFYVGKGVGDRCFAHVASSRTTKRDHTLEFAKLERIRAIEAAGLTVRIEVLRHDLDETTAFHVEAAAIDLLRLTDLTNAVSGHRSERWSVAHLNSVYGAKPVVIDPAHRVVLIRVSRNYRPDITDDDLYAATRAWWRVDRRWTVLTNPLSPEHAFSVADGIVRAVYRINGWEEPDDATIADDPRRAGRRAFIGEREPRMESTYLGGDVSSYMVPGAQNPISYANCAGRSRPSD